MTTPTAYRAALAELLQWAEQTSSHYYVLPDVILHARSLLQDPEPQAPSDWDLTVLMDSVGGPEFDSAPKWALPFARLVLARYGARAAEPGAELKQ